MTTHNECAGTVAPAKKCITKILPSAIGVRTHAILTAIIAITT